jgi:anti-sigma factor RsiW
MGASMTCREVTEFLGDWVEGRLDPRERAAFERHLADCPECIAYVRGYRETIRLANDLRSEATPPMPTALIDAILDATRRHR